MRRQIINQGSINKYTALGKGGPFYANAQAFIDAIDNNVILPGKVENASRYLAIPNVHRESNTIDWIIPFDTLNENDQYDIIPWAQASDEEKRNAQEELRVFTNALKRYGREMSRRKDQNSSSALLARYLLGDTQEQELPAIHFPNQDCVFIVDGIPVITFWGFSNEEQVPLRSPLELLKNNVQPSFISPLNTNLNSDQKVAQDPIPPSEPPVYSNTINNNAPQEETRSHKCFLPAWLLWLLLLLLLIPLLLWLLWKFFGLFAGLFGALFGQTSYPDPYLNSPPAIEAPAENPPVDKLEDPIVDPKEQAEPINKDIAFGDANLPNINLDVPALSGGNLSMSQEPGAMSNGTMAGSSLDSQGLGSLDPIDNGASTTGTNDSLSAPTTGANQDGAPNLANQQDVAPMGNDNASAPLNNNSQNQGSSSAHQGPVIPPDIMANENLSQAQKEAVAAARLAEQQAAIDAARSAENQATQANENKVTPPELTPPGLSHTNGSLAQNGVNLFDGNWKTKSPLMDSANGKPLQMSYNFKDGKGQVTVTRSDGTKCVAPTNANMVNQEIEITNVGRAICPDKSTYQVPKVSCTDHGNGMVKCVGIVGSQRFPITFHQN